MMYIFLTLLLAAITSVSAAIFMSACASKRKCQKWHFSFVSAGSTAE